jgi:hypothetical protein
MRDAEVGFAGDIRPEQRECGTGGQQQKALEGEAHDLHGILAMVPESTTRPVRVIV